MGDAAVNVRSLLLPIEGVSLLLPNAAVAEIIAYRDAESLREGPDWLVGILPWRGLRIPLICYEAVLGRSVPAPENRLRIAVLNTLNGDPNLPFFALVLQGIPHLITANDGVVSTRGSDVPELRAIAAYATAESESALIPDLDVLERMLNELPVRTG